MLNSKAFRHQTVIKEQHLDTFGHVNNAVYLQLMEEARWDFLKKHGFTLQTIHHVGIAPVILECHIKFLKELTLNQSITIESQMKSFEEKIGSMRQDILNEHHELCSAATIVFGFFNIKTRKLIIPTKEWLTSIGIESTES